MDISREQVTNALTYSSRSAPTTLALWENTPLDKGGFGVWCLQSLSTSASQGKHLYKLHTFESSWCLMSTSFSGKWWENLSIHTESEWLNKCSESTLPCYPQPGVLIRSPHSLEHVLYTLIYTYLKRLQSAACVLSTGESFATTEHTVLVWVVALSPIHGTETFRYSPPYWVGFLLQLLYWCSD